MLLISSQGSNGKGIAVAYDKPLNVPSYFIAPSNGWLKVHILRYTGNRIYNIILNVASQTYRNSSTELTKTSHQGEHGDTSIKKYFANSVQYNNYINKGDIIKWSAPLINDNPIIVNEWGKDETICTFYPCR